MGNCMMKKDLVSERLQADILFLQKENIRTYDYIVGELDYVKAIINEKNYNSNDSSRKHFKISSV